MNELEADSVSVKKDIRLQRQNLYYFDLTIDQQESSDCLQITKDYKP